MINIRTGENYVLFLLRDNSKGILSRLKHPYRIPFSEISSSHLQVFADLIRCSPYLFIAKSGCFYFCSLADNRFLKNRLPSSLLHNTVHINGHRNWRQWDQIISRGLFVVVSERT